MVTKIPQTAPAIGNQLARSYRIDQENRPHRHLFQQPANAPQRSFASDTLHNKEAGRRRVRRRY